MLKIEEGKTYIGIVEDNNDPKKLGRVKVRVLNVFDDLEVADLPWAKPWKDLNGNAFNIPDKGKVLTVVFENANVYKPEFICADHFNINLEKKLAGLGEADYLTMKSVIFDHKTQIYVNEGEGLKLDHKFNLINIKESSINVNLKDNFGKINLGTANSTQRAILGDNFLNWFDDFVKILIGDKGGPFLGNLGAPVIATPALMSNIQIYQQKKEPKFLSKNVYIVDNENVSKLSRIAEGQKGDSWQSTLKQNNLTSKEPVNYQPTPGASNTQFDKPKEDAGTQSSSATASQSTDPGKGTDQVPANIEQANQGSPPVPAEHPDIPVLLQLMSDKGYVIYTDQFKMNIVAIRNQCLVVGDKYSDEFTDQLYVFYKDDKDNWDVKQYRYSTMPGVEFTISDQWISERPNLQLLDFWKENKNIVSTIKDYYKVESYNTEIARLAPNKESGLPILVPSQYIDVYYMDTYRGAAALLTHPDSLQQVWFDSDYTRPYNFTPTNFTSPATKNSSGGGDFKIYVQRGYPGGKKVGDWSEGSHCFADSESLSEFFELCTKHKEKHTNIFSYTLATKTDWDAAARAVELDKQSPSPQPPAPAPPPVSASASTSGSGNNGVVTSPSSTSGEASTSAVAVGASTNPNGKAKLTLVDGGVYMEVTDQNWVISSVQVDADDSTNSNTVYTFVFNSPEKSQYSIRNTLIKSQTFASLGQDAKTLNGYPNVEFMYTFLISEKNGYPDGAKERFIIFNKINISN